MNRMKSPANYAPELEVFGGIGLAMFLVEPVREEMRL